MNTIMKDMWKTFFEYLYDGILIVDEQHVVRYINPSYTRITGITGDEIVGRPLKEVRPGARLVEVVSSGNPIVGALRREKGITQEALADALLARVLGEEAEEAADQEAGIEEI